MADVKVRKLDDWVVDALKQRAANAGHSLEEELRLVLAEAAMRPQWEFAEQVAALREKLRRKHGTFTDSAELIRQDRDERG